MKVKRALYFLSIVLLCIGAARFCHHQTKGFRLTKVQHNWDPNATDVLSQEEIHLIRSVFAYPFRYLGRGKQSFAFSSDDGMHVVKIFNNTHQRKIALFRMLSHIPFLNKWALQKAELWEIKLAKAFDSYRIAFTEMKDKTGLIFMHLGATQSLPPLTVIDALNIHHRLDSNTLGFLIQKKGQLVYPALEEMIQTHAIARAEQTLCKLLDLFLWKFHQGISDSDPLIRTNFAVLDDEVIQIDVGPFSKNSYLSDPEKMHVELRRITASLKNWLSERSPELSLYLEHQLEERLSYTQTTN
jgi:hypothetical protein